MTGSTQQIDVGACRADLKTDQDETETNWVFPRDLHANMSFFFFLSFFLGGGSWLLI